MVHFWHYSVAGPYTGFTLREGFTFFLKCQYVLVSCSKVYLHSSPWQGGENQGGGDFPQEILKILLSLTLQGGLPPKKPPPFHMAL